MLDPNITTTKAKGRKKPWLVRWYGEFDVRTCKRKRHSRSFARKVEAEQFTQQLKDDFDSGLPTGIRDITLEELMGKFMPTKKKQSPRTIEGYYECKQRLLDYFHPHTPIRRIRKEDAENFISNMDYISEQYKNTGKTIADSTVDRQLRQSKAIFNKAVEWSYISCTV